MTSVRLSFFYSISLHTKKFDIQEAIHSSEFITAECNKLLSIFEFQRECFMKT